MSVNTYCVYVIVNLLNAKKYVGCTGDLTRRMGSHWYHGKRGTGLPVNRAMFADGHNNFVYGVAEWAETREAAFAAERATIAALGTTDPSRGYNIAAGAIGPRGITVSEETRRKLSAAHMGKPGYWKGKQLLPHVVAAMTARGLAMSDEARQNLAVKMTGRAPSAETRAKLSAVHRGRIFSDEHRARISEGNRKAWAREAVPRVFGETSGSAKLTALEVVAIVSACESGEPPAVVADRYGVHRRTVTDILLGKTWKQTTGRRYAANRAV